MNLFFEMFLDPELIQNNKTLYNGIIDWMYEISQTKKGAPKKVLTENCFKIVSERLRLTIGGASSLDERKTIQAVYSLAKEKLNNKLDSLPEKDKEKKSIQLQNIFHREGTSLAKTGFGAGISLTLGQLSGFGLYTGAVSALHTLGSALGITFAFSTYTSLTSALAIIFGPTGFGIVGLLLGGAALKRFSSRKERALVNLLVELCFIYEEERLIKNSSKTLLRITQSTKLGDEIELIENLEASETNTSLSEELRAKIVKFYHTTKDFDKWIPKTPIPTDLKIKIDKLRTSLTDSSKNLYRFLILGPIAEISDQPFDPSSGDGKSALPPDGSSPGNGGGLPPHNDKDPDDENQFNEDIWTYLGFMSESEVMNPILTRDIIPILHSENNIFLYGPTGHLKREIAETIHKRQENFKGEFVPVVCSRLRPENFREDFIGNGKNGYFTRANGGTLLLERIDKADIQIVSELLQIFGEGMYESVKNTPVPVNWRTIITSRKSLDDGSKNVLALCERLESVELNIPDFSSRPEDIAPLAMLHLTRTSLDKKNNLDNISTTDLDNLLQPRFTNRSTRRLIFSMKQFVTDFDILDKKNLEDFIERKFLPKNSSNEPQIEEISFNEINALIFNETIEFSGAKGTANAEIRFTSDDLGIDKSTVIKGEEITLLYFLAKERELQTIDPKPHFKPWLLEPWSHQSELYRAYDLIGYDLEEKLEETEEKYKTEYERYLAEFEGVEAEKQRIKFYNKYFAKWPFDIRNDLRKRHVSTINRQIKELFQDPSASLIHLSAEYRGGGGIYTLAENITSIRFVKSIS